MYFVHQMKWIFHCNNVVLILHKQHQEWRMMMNIATRNRHEIGGTISFWIEIFLYYNATLFYFIFFLHLTTFSPCKYLLLTKRKIIHLVDCNTKKNSRVSSSFFLFFVASLLLCVCPLALQLKRVSKEEKMKQLNDYKT
jgi:hypothetical protein